MNTGFQRNDRGSSGGRLTIVLVAISIILFTVSARGGDTGFLGGLRSFYQTITLPISYIGTVVSRPFQGIGNAVSNMTADEATLQDLESENRQLKAENTQLKESQETATRLQALLDLQDSYNLQSTAAHIINASRDSWSDTVTIDKGSADGLDVGMTVTDSSGVIGQISQVSADAATVRLITDANSGVAAMVQESRAQGMLNGSADGTLSLNMIRTDQAVNVGDVVVTSGLGGVYPKGLPLGTVSAVDKLDGALYYTISVTPAATTESYEEVLVITSLTSGQSATSDDIAEADAQEGMSTGKSDEDSSSEGGRNASNNQSDTTTNSNTSSSN